MRLCSRRLCCCPEKKLLQQLKARQDSVHQLASEILGGGVQGEVCSCTMGLTDRLRPRNLMRCQGSAQEEKLGWGHGTLLIKEEEVKRRHATATGRPLEVPKITGIAFLGSSQARMRTKSSSVLPVQMW